MMRLAGDARAVLFLGGRQAGKSTLLTSVAGVEHHRYDVERLESLLLPVYVDLMRMKDGTVDSAYHLILDCAISACERCIRHYPRQRLDAARTMPTRTLEELARSLASLRSGAGNTDLQFLLLLDEAKRLVGGPSGRLVQDNLFSLLYGAMAAIVPCAIVFAGAQELYSLCLDDTSPIGSRAAKLILPNLDVHALAEMADLRSAGTAGSIAHIAELVFAWTGGQAGLSDRFLVHAKTSGWPTDAADAESVASAILKHHSELFHVWRNAYSREALAVHDLLLSRGSVSLRDIVTELRSGGFDPFRADRAREEVVFTGLAHDYDGTLTLSNKLYARFARRYLGSEAISVTVQLPAEGSTPRTSHPQGVEEDEVRLALAPDYELGERIGSGAFGIVYSALERRLNREVAVKVLRSGATGSPADLVQRFRQEAAAVGGLRHPVIIQVYSIHERNGILYFVMPRLQGQTLDVLITAHRAGLNTNLAVRLLVQLAGGLGAAHAASVVHRDVKPANVMVENPRGNPVILDFGVALITGLGSARITQGGMAVGTPLYMSPEQAIGSQELDHRTDVYSLGIVAYELLNGHVPFEADTAAKVMAAHLEQPAPPCRPTVPAEIASAVARCLAKNPQDRYQSMEQFAAALSS